MSRIKSITASKKNIFKILLIGLVLIALPLTLILVRQSQDQRSKASYDVSAYIESGGRIVIEAERANEVLANGTGHNWTQKSAGPYPQYPNITLKYMQSLPNTSKVFYSSEPSPEMRYLIQVSNPGTYYVFIRASAAGPNADSVHVGIDGGQKKNMSTYYEGKYGYISDWSWDGNGTPVALNIPAGLHTFNIWAREDGAKIDRVLLVKNSKWKPSNHSDRGDGESTRTTVTVGSPTPVPCIKQQPSIEMIGETSKDVVQDEAVEFTVRVTNRNSAQCPPISFSMSTIFDPVTTDIDYNYSEDNFTLNSGASKDVLVTFTPGKSLAGSITSAKITTTETESNQSATITVSMNVIPLTTLRFNKVVLHGIGIGGDNANPAGPGNQNPITTTKTLEVEIDDSGGNLTASTNGEITYDNAKGYYSGDIAMGTSISSGSYTIKVKTHKYLWQDIEGIPIINTEEINTMPDVELIAGDINSDDETTLADYDILIGCYADLLPAIDCDPTRKFNSDLTDDGFVNADDYNFLLREWSNHPGS